jgi:predicted dehydrogenase
VKRVGVIGCGQWGPNHIRNFDQSGRSRVIRCADRDRARLAAMRRLFPGIETGEDGLALARADDLDCVVVATPPASHHALVSAALESGKDVLCEKPLCADSRLGADLAALARRERRILMVGHVFLFNAGVRALRERMRAGQLGRVRYLHATRTNLGPIRTDVNAAMDLASHDVSIFAHLLGGLPESVSARGQAWLHPGIEDVVFASLRYPGEVLANLHVSWMDPRKVRRLTVVGDAGMALFDDIDVAAPLTFYDKTVQRDLSYESFGEFRLRTHEGDVMIPKLHLVEPLREQTAHFLDCVETRTPPLSDARSGVEVVRVIEALQRSMALDGAPVRIDPPEAAA